MNFKMHVILAKKNTTQLEVYILYIFGQRYFFLVLGNWNFQAFQMEKKMCFLPAYRHRNRTFCLNKQCRPRSNFTSSLIRAFPVLKLFLYL